jgi:hypothetical protein
MEKIKINVLFAISVGAFTCFSDPLEIRWDAPKISGQKAVLRMEIENHLPQKVESLRVSVFLMEASGKTLAQGSRWVIGENGIEGLAAGKTNVFNFIVSGSRDLPTNITARVSPGRVVFKGGQLGDVEKDIKVKQR